jgi:hypothetical protein
MLGVEVVNGRIVWEGLIIVGLMVVGLTKEQIIRIARCEMVKFLDGMLKVSESVTVPGECSQTTP